MVTPVYAAILRNQQDSSEDSCALGLVKCGREFFRNLKSLLEISHVLLSPYSSKDFFKEGTYFPVNHFWKVYQQYEFKVLSVWKKTPSISLATTELMYHGLVTLCY